jgi:hypothetical protein
VGMGRTAGYQGFTCFHLTLVPSSV